MRSRISALFAFFVVQFNPLLAFGCGPIPMRLRMDDSLWQTSVFSVPLWFSISCLRLRVREDFEPANVRPLTSRLAKYVHELEGERR